MSLRHDPLENLVEMDFGTAAKRVLDILPVQNEDLHQALGCYFLPMTPIEMPV